MTASGPISTIQDKWRTLIASTYSFQHWDGNVWDLTEAKDHVFHDQAPDPADGNAYTQDELTQYFPCCVVWTAYHRGYVIEALAEDNAYYDSGHLVAEFYRVPDLKIEDNPDETFRNMIGKLIWSTDTEEPGIVERARTPGYLVPRRIEVFGPITNADPEDPQLERVQKMRLEIDWPSSAA